ncbi:MAG TPA: CCA tRNA nucleotidyltransferase [Methanocorpusculum sp.]|nr:CCA tRNA nucleotidyltransferase [Methanocorpusculum sp.]
MNRDDIESIVLSRVKPDDAERADVEKMGRKIIDSVFRNSGVHAMMTGSAARGTWVKGDKDIDIFMLFPPELTREELQEKGLDAAYAVVNEFKGHAEEKYAEHPYLNAVIEGFDVDLVPCYNVASTAEMKCAVDRTPFHTRYLIERLGDLKDDVLLLKQFAKGGGVYGSDLMTGGFSGYLCELLILRFGGFQKFIEAACKFGYGEVVDLEGYYKDKKTVRRKFSEPLIVIDPTDKDRNVAAALTLTRYSEFIELARDYCANPSIVYFEPDVPTTISKVEFSKMLDERKTKMLALVMKTPDYVPDTIVPQLRKTMESIRSMLIREEFQVHRSEVVMGGENCMIVFELLISRLPDVIIREGPPVWSHENADKFVDKYIGGGEFAAGPWISDERYYTEVRRKYTSAESLLNDRESILSGSLGRHIRKSMEEGYSVLVGDEIWSPEFSMFLSAYFSRASHAVRKLRRIKEIES